MRRTWRKAVKQQVVFALCIWTKLVHRRTTCIKRPSRLLYVYMNLCRSFVGSPSSSAYNLRKNIKYECIQVDFIIAIRRRRHTALGNNPQAAIKWKHRKSNRIVSLVCWMDYAIHSLRSLMEFIRIIPFISMEYWVVSTMDTTLKKRNK